MIKNNRELIERIDDLHVINRGGRFVQVPVSVMEEIKAELLAKDAEIKRLEEEAERTDEAFSKRNTRIIELATENKRTKSITVEDIAKVLADKKNCPIAMDEYSWYYYLKKAQAIHDLINGEDNDG